VIGETAYGQTKKINRKMIASFSLHRCNRCNTTVQSRDSRLRIHSTCIKYTRFRHFSTVYKLTSKTLDKLIATSNEEKLLLAFQRKISRKFLFPSKGMTRARGIHDNCRGGKVFLSHHLTCCHLTLTGGWLRQICLVLEVHN
jgi:hypothetical protein